MFHRMSFLKGSGLAQSRPVLSHCFHSTNQSNAISYTNYCIFFCNVPLYTSQRSITYLEWVSGLVKRVDGLDRATLQQSPYLSLRACTSLLLILVTPNSFLLGVDYPVLSPVTHAVMVIRFPMVQIDRSNTPDRTQAGGNKGLGEGQFRSIPKARRI